MNKKLIALAVVAAVAAPVAMADVTLYGSLGVGIGNDKDSDAASSNGMFRVAGAVGFKGFEDLGNGLKAIWQVENRVDPSGNEHRDTTKFGQHWGSRDTFVGLEGGFGKVRVGNLIDAGGAVAGWNDPYYAGDIDGGVSGYGDMGARKGNSIAYNSPDISGLKFAVTHSLKDSTGGYTYGANAQYSVAGFDVIYGGFFNKAKADAHFANSHEVSVGTSFGDVSIGAGYNRLYTGSIGYGVNASYAMGDLTPIVGFWHARHKANTYSAGLQYSLSKRTTAGLEGYYNDYKDSSDKYRSVNVFIYHKF